VGGRTQVLGQARAAEGKAGFQIGTRDVELRVLAHQIHDLEGVDAQRLAQARRFIGEGDLERVEVVAAVLHHLGRSHRGLKKLARQVVEERSQSIHRRRVVGTHHGERRFVVVADRRAFTQELGLETQEESHAVLLAGGLLDDRAQHILDRSGHQR
jgi:hypothetical protein